MKAKQIDFSNGKVAENVFFAAAPILNVAGDSICFGTMLYTVYRKLGNGSGSKCDRPHASRNAARE